MFNIIKDMFTIHDFQHNTLSFGNEVLKSSQTQGFNRFNATLIPGVKPYENGKLYFFQTNSTVKSPDYAVIFLHDKVNLNKPSIHIFFHPLPPPEKTKSYPAGPYWEGLVNNYLVNNDKKLLNQHAALGKKCVFVFPFVPSSTYFSRINTAKKLRDYLKHIIHTLCSVKGKPQKLEDIQLGRCAVSGFSYAGNVLKTIMESSMPTKNPFPELLELYALDCVLEAPENTLDDIIKRFYESVNQWWDGGGNRRVRIYTSYHKMYYNFIGSSSAKNKQKVCNAEAIEYYSMNNFTFLYTPDKFWKTVCAEFWAKHKGSVPNPNICNVNNRNGPLSTHQTMPSVFLQHALKNSGF